MINKVICIVAALATCMTATAQPKLTADNIKEVVAAMTLEEKAALVVGTQRGGVYPPPPAPGMPVRPNDDPMNNAAVTAFSEGRVRGAAGDVLAIPRLGIPTMVLADGPAGLRIDPKRPNNENTYYCTAFPTASLLAATWDAPLIERMTEAIGNEVKEYGVDILLAPGMNIMRNPLCGRNYEYFSEDPVLAGKMAAAYIRGIQSQGVGVSLKHFAVNNQETYRNGIDVRISEQALREIYLRGFEIAVKEGKPWTVMSSYNKINGILASENRWLLKDVLRGEWGFDGFVMTDWWAEENGARQIAAGNDMLMPGTQRQLREILDAINAGIIQERDLDWCVENILRVLVKTPIFKGYKYSNKPDLKVHAKIAREVAAEGMVLLENNGVLPLKKGKRVALLGVDSYDALVGGSGSGHVNRQYEVSIYEGLKQAGFSLDAEQSKICMDYVEAEKSKQNREFFWVVPTINEWAVSQERAEALAQRNDLCILTIGRMAGEGDDRRLEKGDYYLSDLEVLNLQNLCTAFHAKKKPVVVLLSMGSFVEMSSWKHLPDAILHTWLPGQEEGNAIADVLTGKVNPSGKLPFTIAARYEDYSSSANFPSSNGNPAEVEYKEDVFVGYRHFDKVDITPTYPFGYGLSYTSFKYNNMTVKSDGDSITVCITVKNIGKHSGKESVQLYVSAPQDKLNRPVKELKAFAKTRLLKPGQSQMLKMTVNQQDLASWDTATHQWIKDSGIYKFSIGMLTQFFSFPK
ncbi:MAG: glycoside hydrolase family 3 C-terminal domain-containing protein [Prevotella sp.]|nr:glycoside hydrolase family 3 C-terminal domain-containing protein [Prevotella sp.]